MFTRFTPACARKQARRGGVPFTALVVCVTMTLVWQPRPNKCMRRVLLRAECGCDVLKCSLFGASQCVTKRMAPGCRYNYLQLHSEYYTRLLVFIM